MATIKRHKLKKEDRNKGADNINPIQLNIKDIDLTRFRRIKTQQKEFKALLLGGKMRPDNVISIESTI